LDNKLRLKPERCQGSTELSAYVISLHKLSSPAFQDNEEMKLTSAKLTAFALAEDCRLEKNVWFW